MHRINLTIDKDLYEQARAIGFLEKKSISQIVRESLRTYLSKPKRRRAALLLSAQDEKRSCGLCTMILLQPPKNLRKNSIYKVRLFPRRKHAPRIKNSRA